ncbi:Vps51 protein [Maudiozyma humilis]|uniref:Vps51 protein n=1 Tax=Maudiozyma humilis TaxID=51915 RepID=A0AAV5RU36_MAUHU|nr:Vps51 protein [Kazachstania humilis]
MAEQISHKRSLRVKRLDEDKKRLLKEYYKLEDAAGEPKEGEREGDGETPTPENAAATTPAAEELADAEPSAEPTPELRPHDMTLQQLLQVHNRLVGQEIEMGNSIKNTIYDNYYDLVKVNSLLAGVVSPETPGHRPGRAAELLERLRQLNAAPGTGNPAQ